MRKFVFVHLPKTAGSSFHEAMREAFGQELVSPSFIATQITRRQAARLEAFAIISGHISMADVQRYFSDREVLTILRDPIDRCLSWYYFARQQKTKAFSSDFEAAKLYDLQSFFNLDFRLIYRNIYNRQTRQLGDHVLNLTTDMEQATAVAKDTLERALWVGRQESFASDIEDLARRVPEFANVRVAKANVTKERRSADEIDAALAERIRELNVYDLELYNFVSGQVGRNARPSGQASG